MLTDKEILLKNQKSTTVEYYQANLMVMVNVIVWSAKIFKRKLLRRKLVQNNI